MNPKAGGRENLNRSGSRRPKTRARKLTQVLSSGRRHTRSPSKLRTRRDISTVEESDSTGARESLFQKPDTADLPVFKASVDVRQEDYDANYDSDHSTNPSQIWTEPEMPAASTSTVPGVEIASAELVSLLVKHPSLKNLYAPAITLHGQVDIREALLVVLKSYAKALKAAAKQPQEYKAGELVRSYARRIAYACVAFHDPSAPSIDIDERWEALHRQKFLAASRVEDYLNNYGNQTPQYQDPENNVADLSDDSDREDIGEPLPNLSKVTTYMTSGSPFEQLRKDVLSLSTQMSNQDRPTFVKLQKSHMTEKEEFESSELADNDKISKTITSGDLALSVREMVTWQRPFSTIVYPLYYFFKSWLGSHLWPQLSPECTRLNWICECGARLYEDYATTDPETISKLSLLINKPMTATTASSNSSGSFDIRLTRTSAVSSNNNLSIPPVYENSRGEGTHLCQVFNRSCRLCLKSLPRKFLALCVNTGRFHKTLGEIDVTDIYRDSEAFRQIKARYLEVRSFRARARRLFLLRASNVHFVKINIEDTYRADIVETPSVPPLTEVHAKRYEYSPLDLPLPPITSNSFMHYLENPECESLQRTSRWLGCLPKRLEEQLLSRRRSSEPDTIVSGWGIHIDETLNEEALAILVLIILLFSAFLGITYSAKTGDASGGFTIAGYIATVMGVVVAVLYFKWQDG
ncbi:hypothetical protein N431DRAFT_472372 [Stipitochalara longipes BDJ]|nr:hypothetical protein N431DRAFT_472372 [Stipitochalara longipes BDJ]